jgi:hypothetical protein
MSQAGLTGWGLTGTGVLGTLLAAYILLKVLNAEEASPIGFLLVLYVGALALALIIKVLPRP